MTKYHLIFLTFLLLISCKKKEDAPSNEPIPESETPVSSNSSYDALFSSIQSYTKTSSTYAFSGTKAFGYYSSKLINNDTYYSGDLRNIGTVSLNDIILKNKSNLSSYYYNDTTFTNFSPPYFWKILGSTEVDSFSYSNPNPPPTISISSTFIDSIQTSIGATFQLKNISNCDLIRIYMNDGNTNSINKFYAGTDSLIYLSPSDLQNLDATANGNFVIYFYKNIYRSINSKKVNFRSGISYSNSSFKIRF